MLSTYGVQCLRVPNKYGRIDSSAPSTKENPFCEVQKFGIGPTGFHQGYIFYVTGVNALNTVFVHKMASATLLGLSLARRFHFPATPRLDSQRSPSLSVLVALLVPLATRRPSRCTHPRASSASQAQALLPVRFVPDDEAAILPPQPAVTFPPENRCNHLRSLLCSCAVHGEGAGNLDTLAVYC